MPFKKDVTNWESFEDALARIESDSQKKSNSKKKSGAKKSSAKSTAKKKTGKQAAPKKQAKKKTAPTPPVQPQSSLFHKKTIAEKTVAHKTRNRASVFCWIGIVICLILAFFFKFFLLGYSFTVMVLLGIAGILLFYALIPQLAKTYPLSARRLKRVVTTLLCIGLIVVGITEFFIIRASLGEPKESCNYVVVLGAKIRETGPSASLWDRIYGAQDYLEDHPDVIAVLSGGQGQDEPMTEAQAMYDELIKLGIDEDRLWIEDRATSTWENLNFSLDLIEEKTGTRPEKIGIISSEYHLFRASLFADACKVESVLIPAQTSVFTQRINHFMREVAGVWHYLILGGQYE